MLALIVALVVTTQVNDDWSNKTTIPVTGTVSYYNHGVMERVAYNRGYINSIEEYEPWISKLGVAGAVAGMRRGDLNRYAFVYWLDMRITAGPFIVVDCSALSDYVENTETLNRILEIDYATAMALKMDAPMLAVVTFVDEVSQEHKARYIAQ